MGRLKRRAAPLLFFLISALLLVGPVLLRGHLLLPTPYVSGFAPWSASEQPLRDPQWNPLLWDALAQFYPWRLLLAQAAAEGKVALWNPYVLCGAPLLANSQSAPFYPLHLLYLIPSPLSVGTRLTVLALLHLTIAGWGAFRLARGLQISAVGALAAGVGYQLSTSSAAWLEIPSVISVTCWIPLVLAAARRLEFAPSPRTFAGLALCTGLMLLGGHLQFALFGLLALAAVTAWGQISAPSLRSLFLTGAAVAVALGLAAVQLLPVRELAAMSHRTAVVTAEGYRSLAAYSLPPAHWITLVAPDFYGLSSTGDFWGYWNYGATNLIEYAGGIGLPGLLLALAALRLRPGRTWTGWTCLLLTALGLLLSTDTPLLRALYYLLPGFAASGSPARALILLSLGLSLMAGLGVQELTCDSASWRRLLLKAAPATAAAMLIGLLLAAAARQFVPMDRTVQVDQLLAEISTGALVRAAGGSLLMFALILGAVRLAGPRRAQTACAGACLAGLTAWLLWSGAPMLVTGPEAPLLTPPPGVDLDLLRNRRVATVTGRWNLMEHPGALVPPNLSVLYGWRDVQGYDSLQPAHYRRLLDAAGGSGGAAPPENGNMTLIRNPSSPLIALTGADLLLQKPVYSGGGGLQVTRVPGSVPDAYLAPRWRVMDDAGAVARLTAAASSSPLTAEAILSPGPELSEAAAPPARTSAAGAPVQTIRTGPGRIRAILPQAASGFLVLTETWMPGWKATLIGPGSTEIRRTRRVNVAFQGVEIPRDVTRVDFSYEPDSFRVGLFVSAAALAFLGCLWFSGCCLAPAARRAPAPPP